MIKQDTTRKENCCLSTRNTRKSKYDPEDNKKSADGKSIRVKKTIVYEEDEQGNITIISSGNTDPEEAYRIVSTYSPILHGKATLFTET